MLAQNFMPATALGTTDAELEALIKVLGMLERGECDRFSMSRVRHECGSPSCMLGWAQSVLGDRDALTKKGGIYGKTDALEDLFFPKSRLYPEAYPSDQATAALALRNFLTLGEPRWAEVLKAY
jgi:hypothetical protein